MLPLSLLNAAQGQPMMVELKSGETLNGHLVNCDTWMNLTLKEVIQTSADGEHFLKLPETYVRGNIIKYLRVPEELLDMIKEDRQNRSDSRNQQRNQERNQGRGGRNQGRGGQNRGGYNRNYNRQGGSGGGGGGGYGGGNRQQR